MFKQASSAGFISEEFNRKTDYIHFGQFYILDLSCWNVKKKIVILLIITSDIYLYVQWAYLSERQYFVFYGSTLTLKMKKMVLYPFCDETLQML